MVDSNIKYTVQSESTHVNAALRSYFLKIYNYMALGVALTGVVVLFMAANPKIMVPLAVGPMKWILFLAVLGMGFFANFLFTARKAQYAYLFFFIYAALWGVMISPMVAFFLRTTAGTMDVARAFFITAGMFAGSSLYGYVTKKNLSAFGRFFMMASIGLLIALLLNAFLIKSGAFGLLLSIAVVLLFAGITAYDTQKLKDMYFQVAHDDHMRERMTIMGAFILYGDFITMFIYVLQILGVLRGND